VERKRERGNALVGENRSPARLGYFFMWGVARAVHRILDTS
jgi:hypothetical protein